MNQPLKPRRSISIDNRSAARSIAAITGLVSALGLMWALGLGGMIYGFLFGASGAVLGGVIGERLHDWKSGS